MKLFYSPSSPYVRKVLIVAHEVGLAGRIENVVAAVHPINRSQTVIAHNPLGQLPTLITDEGQALADSRVICEYLDHLGKGGLFPSDSRRWTAINDQSMADGLLAAALLARYEGVVRTPEQQNAAWVGGQMDKIKTTLTALNAAAPGLGARVDIGTIGFAAAVSYLDLRFATLDWRAAYPAAASWYKAFATRPSMVATELKG
jgi:glutathione S-transferase